MMDAGAASSPIGIVSENLSEEESFSLEQPRGGTSSADRSLGFDNGSFLSSNSPALMDVVDENQKGAVPVGVPSLEGMSPIAKRRRLPLRSSCDDGVHGGFESKRKTYNWRSGAKEKEKKQTSTPITSFVRSDAKTPQVSAVLFETPGTSEFGAAEPSRFVDSREIAALSVVEDELVDWGDNCDGDIVSTDDAQVINCSYDWVFDEKNPAKNF